MVRIMRTVAKLETAPHEKSALLRLVEFFPDATPMRIPISVVVPRGKGQGLEESTSIEFGTSKMVFFESRLPLELEDKLQLRNSDGSFGAEAIVVALRLNDGRRAIAAQFVAEVRNWIIQS
jgi:hypothetical protein